MEDLNSSRDHAPNTCAGAIATAKPIDLGKIKPGDELTISVAFKGWAYDDSTSTFLTDAGVSRHGLTEFWSSRIVSHTPRAIAVGDRVTSAGHAARVVAAHNGDVCIIFDREPEHLNVRPAHMLVRADD